MTTPNHCTVCGADGVREYGGRSFCLTHHESFATDQGHHWQAGIIALATIPSIAVFLGILDTLITSAPAIARLGANFAASLLPAMALLGALYVYQRRSHMGFPRNLPTVMLIGAIVAIAAGRPVLQDAINIDSWEWQAPALARFAGSVLIGGSIHSFSLMAILRFVVWPYPGFSKRVHGVTYGLSVSIAYSCAIAALAVWDERSLSLLNGSMRLLTDHCAILVPGLVLGYHVGRNKFEDLPFYYLGTGFVTAAALNGLLHFAGSALNSTRLGAEQDGFNPWPGFLVGVSVLLVCYGVVYGLLQRHNTLTRARMKVSY